MQHEEKKGKINTINTPQEIKIIQKTWEKNK